MRWRAVSRFLTHLLVGILLLYPSPDKAALNAPPTSHSASSPSPSTSSSSTSPLASDSQDALNSLSSHTYLAHALVRYLGAGSPMDLAAFGIGNAGDMVDLVSRVCSSYLSPLSSRMFNFGLLPIWISSSTPFSHHTRSLLIVHLLLLSAGIASSLTYFFSSPPTPSRSPRPPWPRSGSR